VPELGQTVDRKEPPMLDESQTLSERSSELNSQLEAESQHYTRIARTNYYLAQTLAWASSGFGLAAAVLGLIPWDRIAKWEVGLLAAISAALVTVSRQLGLQQKANWHYRKVDSLNSLRRRLQFELPVSPSADNIAAISRAWSALDSDMSKEWENMQHEPTVKPEKPADKVSRNTLSNP
jgi:hypothetical protein